MCTQHPRRQTDKSMRVENGRRPTQGPLKEIRIRNQFCGLVFKSVRPGG